MFKFNGGIGAIICDNCRVIIKEGANSTDADEHLCGLCESGKPMTKASTKAHTRWKREKARKERREGKDLPS